MKLYSGIVSVFGMKAEMAALEKNLPVDVELVPFSIAAGYAPKHPEVMRVNPKGQVPVLIDDGIELFDSTQIIEYFEHLSPIPALWPETPKERARARLLELTVDEIFFPHVVRLFPSNRSKDAAVNEQTVTTLHNFYTEFAQCLNRHGGPYLLGPLSYVDLTLLAALMMAEAVGVPLPASHDELHTWRTRMLSRTSARPVARAVTMFRQLGLPMSGFAAAH